MTMRPRALALAVALAALGPAVAARAATTVGSDLARPANATACATSCTAFTTQSSAGAPVAVAPWDGVIVRWRVRAGAAAGGIALRAVRSSGTGAYVGAGTSEIESVAAGISTFDTRVRVKAGDVIGADASAGAPIFATSTTTDVQSFSPQLGSTAGTPVKQPGRELLVNADIERDADGDGYGDETQDQCPTDPTRHDACLSNLSVSVSPAPAPLTVGRSLLYTVRVGNDGPSPAQDVGLVVNLPSSATPVTSRAGRGFCSGAYTFTCRFGTLDAGDQGTLYLTVRPETVGTLVTTAQASTSTAETSAADNSATSDVTVLPPALRLLDLRLSRPLIRVRGTTTIRWYETDFAKVTVAVQQITRKGRLRPSGAFSLTGRPGSNSAAFRGRVPRRRPLKPGSYRFVVSAATPDGRVAAAQHLSFTVRPRRR